MSTVSSHVDSSDLPVSPLSSTVRVSESYTAEPHGAKLSTSKLDTPHTTAQDKNQGSSTAVHTLRQTFAHKVEEVRYLNDSTYVLRFSRDNMTFVPGQHLCVGINDLHMREYSVYSGKSQSFLEILIKKVENGLVSHQLANLQVGHRVACEGPFGYFTIEKDHLTHPLYFIATGTGIAPFHCYALSHDLQEHAPWTILHGIRSPKDRFEFLTYKERSISYLPCYSQHFSENEYEPHAYYHGRVTDYIMRTDFPEDAYFFLCGNSDMIYEVYDILQNKNFESGRFKAEVYF